MSTTSAATATPSKTAARRGPRKVRLDTTKIVAAGLEVAEETGSDTFSPKLLGDKLGVDPSAVYRHFQSKRHLMEALLDAVHLRTVEAVTAPPEAWRDRVIQLADATLSAVHEYLTIPDLYTLVAVQAIEIAANPVVVCLVEYNGEHGGCVLVGAAESVMNEAIGVVKATLDAINRSIGRLTGEDGIS
mgnify:CR=1 FL=1